MKYYLIVGEASGDLHASHLMKSIKQYDREAEFRFFGGDNMSAVGGTRVKHYKELAYMGFVPVLLHLRTIFAGMDLCKKDIIEWQPDCVILVDYAGFNLSIAKFLRREKEKKLKSEKVAPHVSSSNISNDSLTSSLFHSLTPKVFYYISPKIWAWKEYRIKNFKRDVDEMFSILPFEVDFFEKKHHYPIHYVGNPTADEVREFWAGYTESHEEFCRRYNLDPQKPIIALLAGSRKQEIKDNLPTMLKVMKDFPDYQPVLACAPGVSLDYYQKYLTELKNLGGNYTLPPSNGGPGWVSTYALLSNSVAALVTSGTATLETALFDVPQVVCYKTPVPRLIRWCFNHIIKCKYISLVNLIADKEVVQELFADRFSVENITNELRELLPGGGKRDRMLKEYDEIDVRLGDEVAPDNAARLMVEIAHPKPLPKGGVR